MKPTRRDMLRFGSALVLAPAARCSRVALKPEVPAPAAPDETIVNDIHSQLNRTVVDRVIRPGAVEQLCDAVVTARARGRFISVCGRRHSMGGQQFGAGTTLIDLTGLNRVLSLNRENGVVEMEAGVEWPELLAYLRAAQQDGETNWGIMQKQTGADRLSIGGALASNVHGRGLTFKPLIDQIESFTLIDQRGELRRCSRPENAELFRLAIGGYGLFGIVTSVRMRLWPRKKVERVVEIRDLKDIPGAFALRIADGYLYGDFQYATDSNRDSFMRRGVFSTYRPVDPATPITRNQIRFHPDDWARLTYYTHKYKRRAFDVYTKRYLETSGQIYWSDSQLSAAYKDDYHRELDRKLGAKDKGSEMITEIYVPRASLISFMETAREELKRRRANVIYGAVRLIEKDEESFLAWAREPWACIIFNLHIDHTPQKIEVAAAAFRGLIDIAIAHQGSYYLTYHRWAGREQLEKCYPRFREFLALKRKHDPDELFQSDWYRHHREMFA
ncbi:MAG: FAD-binding protein [Blastocatellia bacterium]